jgi:D-3-phosphoglycerate dehydrogenase
MRVVAFDPMGDESWCRRAGVTFVTLDELLSQSDFITVHVPLTDQTRGLLNRETLAKTKKGRSRDQLRPGRHCRRKGVD